ncbi:hypothetical protein DGN16_17025 [Xanthomonas citri pv. fuscans]|nr:hypothetical protein DGN16_17025 [Xanthomonas citri pv. fuscans]
MDYRDPETARRRSIFHQRIQIGFPGRSFVVDLQSYFSSLLWRPYSCCQRQGQVFLGSVDFN